MRTNERLIRDLIGQLIPFSRGNHIAHAQIWTRNSRSIYAVSNGGEMQLSRSSPKDDHEGDVAANLHFCADFRHRWVERA